MASALVGPGGGLVGPGGGLVGPGTPNAFGVSAVIRAASSGSFTLDARKFRAFPFTLNAVIKAARIFGASYTDTIRPNSDVIASSAGFSSGSTGWNLVNEVVLDTGNYWRLFNNGIVINGFTTPADMYARAVIDSINFTFYETNGAPANDMNGELRNPATGNRYTVFTVGQNVTGFRSSGALTTRPWDSAAWSLNDLMQMQAGAADESAGTFTNLFVYQSFIDVVLHYPGGITLNAFIPRYFKLDARIQLPQGFGQFTANAVIKGPRYFGVSRTDILRPTSDVVSSLTGFSSGSTGWNLVNEAVLDTSNWWQLFNSGMLFHGFGTLPYLAAGTLASASVAIHFYDTNNAAANDMTVEVRNPATGSRYSVGTIFQNDNGFHAFTVANRPWDSQPWNVGDLQNLQTGMADESAGTFTNLFIYQWWLEVTYAWPGGITLDAVIVGPVGADFPLRAVVLGQSAGSFTLDASWRNIATGAFVADAVRLRVGSPFIGNLAFPGTSITLTPNTANDHSGPIPLAAGSTITVVVTTPPDDGGALAVVDPATNEIYSIGTSPGVYSFAVLGGTYHVVSAFGSSYRPTVGGVGSYINPERSQFSATLDAVVLKLNQTHTFTLDARSANIVTGSFSANAFIRAFFDVNAVIRSSRTSSFTVAAQIVIRVTGSFTLRAVKTGFLLRAVIKAHSGFLLFNLNAYKSFATVSRTFTLDARSRGFIAYELHLFATIRRSYTSTTTLNAYIFAPARGFFSLNSVVQGPLIFGFRVEWQTDYNRTTPTGSFGARAFVVGTRASFTLDAETVSGTHTRSFTLNAVYQPTGSHQGFIAVSAYVLGRVSALFGLNADIELRRIFLDAYVRVPSFTANAFVQPWFSLDAMVKKPQPSSFTANARIDPLHRSSSFTANGFVGTAGQHYGTFALACVIRSHPFLPGVIYVSATIRVPPKTFTLNARIPRYFKINAFIRPSFTLNAYIQGTNIIIYPPDGGPPTYGPGGPPVTGGGMVSRKFRIKFELGIVTGEVDEAAASAAEANSATLATDVETYLSIPAASRSDAQNSALATDLDTLDRNMQTMREAHTPPTEWREYTGDIMWSETSFTQAARTGVGHFTVTLDGAFTDIHGGEECHLEVDDRRIFGGYVTNVSYIYDFPDAPPAKTVLSGVDYNILFDRLFVYNVIWELHNFGAGLGHAGPYREWDAFPTGTMDNVAIDFIMKYYVGYNYPADLDISSAVDAVGTISDDVPWRMPEPGSPLRTTFQSIGQATGGVWYIDALKRLNYHDRYGDANAPAAITDGFGGGITSRDMVVTSDTSAMVNDIWVWGILSQGVDGSLMFSHGLEQDSIDTYGRSVYGEFRQDIFHPGWLRKRAQSIRKRYRDPIIKADATIFEPYFGAGQRVELISSEYGIDETLVITELTISFVVPKEPQNSIWYALPVYRLTMGLDPEAPWNIYDFLPFPGEGESSNASGAGSSSSSSAPGAGSMTGGGGNRMGVPQRKFWNASWGRGSDGIIEIGSWSGMESCSLYASQDGCHWKKVYNGAELMTIKGFGDMYGGPVEFPEKYKTWRFWRLLYEADAPGGVYYGGVHINHWLFKPYSDDYTLTGPTRWHRGNLEDNLFWKSSPFYNNGVAKIRYEGHVRMSDPTVTWTHFGGNDNNLYGYRDKVRYFGYNQFGGDKPATNIMTKINAIGDLTKPATGFWGAFGIASGIPNKTVHIKAWWTFDLCHEVERLGSAFLDGHQPLVEHEGWGVETVFAKKTGDDWLFESRVTPVRSTMNVYNVDGLALHLDRDWEDLHDPSGRKYKLIRNAVEPDLCIEWAGGDANEVVPGLSSGYEGMDGGPAGESPSDCEDIEERIVLHLTYLVDPPTPFNPSRTNRITSPSITHDRKNRTDVKGL